MPTWLCTLKLCLLQSLLRRTLARTVSWTCLLPWASIGTPVPCNAIPDPQLINPHFGPNHLGHVNAISPSGLRMVFHALIAVKDGVPIRALVDTGASHSYINQAFLDDQLAHYQIACEQQSNWLTLANGSQVVSLSKCVLPLDIQTYQSAVGCYTLPMSDQFDMILMQDWSIPAGAVMSYRDDSLEVLDLEKRPHKLYSQSIESRLLCPIVSAINLEKDLQDHDSMFLVQVTEADTDHPAAAAGSDSLPEDASLRSVLAAFKDCFPAELPAQLPPERNVYHTIPLKHI